MTLRTLLLSAVGCLAVLTALLPIAASSAEGGSGGVGERTDAKTLPAEHDTAAGRRPVTRTEANGPGTAVAIFGMGCFWGAEADFCVLPGVLKTTVGYAGGHSRDPSYEQVSAGGTGHAEVVQVEYDPAIISFQDLLEVFWQGHDPTIPDRQGPDVGGQYRSLILVHTPEQRAAAQASRQRHAAGLPRPIVTEIAPAGAFYPAEQYHQRYLEKRGRVRCQR